MVAHRSIEMLSGWYRAYVAIQNLNAELEIASLTVAGAAPDLHRFPI